MKKTTQQLQKIAADPWYLVSSALSSLAAFVWFAYEETKASSSIISVMFFSIAIAFLMAGYLYSIKVRVDNIALRRISEDFFEINQIYRNKLWQMFCNDAPVTDPVELLSQEGLALKAVCQRISNIFGQVTGRKCVVTIKLVTTESDKCYAQTYVRSEDLSPRDIPERIRYLVGVGDNTSFDIALCRRPNGLPPHFFSANLDLLSRKHGYLNQRPNYSRFYRSALVVPIQGPQGGEKIPNVTDLIGFLCVDTLSTNRLNDGYHLYMLSALANQMYNFMSFMRGKYTVFVG